MKNTKIKVIALALAVLVIIFDQVTKFCAVEYLEPIKQITVIDGVLNFTYVKNPGAVAGIFANAPWVFNIVTVVAVVLLFVATLLGKFANSKFMSVAVGFIIGGGIGNLIDRLFRVDEAGMHFVVDFIDFVFLPFWTLVFNIADTFVVIGCVMIVLYYLKEIVVEIKTKKEINNA